MAGRERQIKIQPAQGCYIEIHSKSVITIQTYLVAKTNEGNTTDEGFYIAIWN